jgi:hypothetical protein
VKNPIESLCQSVRDFSPNCEQAARLQSESLDLRLPWRQRTGLRIHLMLCQWCRRYAQHLEFLRHAAREYKSRVPEQTQVTLGVEARERIQRALRDQARP